MEETSQLHQQKLQCTNTRSPSASPALGNIMQYCWTTGNSIIITGLVTNLNQLKRHLFLTQLWHCVLRLKWVIITADRIAVLLKSDWETNVWSQKYSSHHCTLRTYYYFPVLIITPDVTIVTILYPSLLPRTHYYYTHHYFPCTIITLMYPSSLSCTQHPHVYIITSLYSSLLPYTHHYSLHS